MLTVPDQSLLLWQEEPTIQRSRRGGVSEVLKKEKEEFFVEAVLGQGTMRWREKLVRWNGVHRRGDLGVHR